MEETSIVWSTESLFPDLHPTVVDTSHSRTLDASTCLRILLIPRSILFSFSLRNRDTSPFVPFQEAKTFERARCARNLYTSYRMSRPMDGCKWSVSTSIFLAWIRANGIATEHFRIAGKNWPIHVRQSSRFAWWTSTIALDYCTREIDQPLRDWTKMWQVIRVIRYIWKIFSLWGSFAKKIVLWFFWKSKL